MKIRSATIALCLGCLLYFVPAVIVQLTDTQPFSGSSAQDEPLSRLPVNMPNTAKTPRTTAVTLSSAEAAQVRAATTDLLISKSSVPLLVKAGDPLTYTIAITNTGAVTAQNLRIFDTLPVGVRFEGESTVAVIAGANAQIEVNTRMLTVTVGFLQPTGAIRITGRTVVEISASGTTLRNTAQVTSTNDSTSGNNEGTVETGLITATPTAPPTPTATPTHTATPTPTHTPTNPPPPTAIPTQTPTATPLPNLANLHLSKSVAPNPVEAGALLTYTLRVSNLGPGIAQDVVIQDILPKGLLFEGLSSLSVARGEGPQLLLSSTELTGTLTLLRVGGIITITAPARVRSTETSTLLINQAIVTSITPETQPADNQTTTVLFLLALPPHKSYLPVIQQ